MQLLPALRQRGRVTAPLQAVSNQLLHVSSADVSNRRSVQCTWFSLGTCSPLIRHRQSLIWLSIVKLRPLLLEGLQLQQLQG